MIGSVAYGGADKKRDIDARRTLRRRERNGCAGQIIKLAAMAAMVRRCADR
jgi:hypothetical protein